MVAWAQGIQPANISNGLSQCLSVILKFNNTNLSSLHSYLLSLKSANGQYLTPLIINAIIMPMFLIVRQLTAAAIYEWNQALYGKKNKKPVDICTGFGALLHLLFI
jgi:hypothetical protein